MPSRLAIALLAALGAGVPSVGVARFDGIVVDDQSRRHGPHIGVTCDDAPAALSRFGAQCITQPCRMVDVYAADSGSPGPTVPPVCRQRAGLASVTSS